MTILWISWFVKYPDVVKGRAIITTRLAPVELVVKEPGELKLLVEDGREVDEGQVLAYISNPATYEDVVLLEQWLQTKNVPFDERTVVLGSIQPAPGSYITSLNRWNEQTMHQPQQQEISHLKRQVASLEELNSNAKEQLDIFEKEIGLLYDKFRTDSILYQQGVIAAMDYKERTAGFLQQQRAIKSQAATIINNEYQMEELQKQISRLSIESRTTHISLRQELENNLGELKNAISRWKRQYLITAPMTGTVSFLNFLEDDQYVQAGTSLMSVVPANNEYYARVSLPVQSSGKVQIGQEVNIRLDNYPSQEFGMLVGKVQKIADVPSEGLLENQLAYTLLVSLPEGLVTSYQKPLPFRQLLSGEMEVITEDRRIIERVFGWTREVFRKG